MFEVKQEVSDALNATKRLDEQNQLFINELIAAKEPNCDIGKLTASPSKVSCFCLNRTLSATCRHVAIENKISAIEYNFVVLWKNEEVSVLCLYLQIGGIITYDAKGSKKLCDFNNTYVKNHILNAVSFGLLSSPVYVPTPP